MFSRAQKLALLLSAIAAFPLGCSGKGGDASAAASADDPGLDAGTVLDASVFAGCKPGGDGTYVHEPYPTLNSYCLAAIVGGAVLYAEPVVPYELNTPLFSDYAIKSRAVFVPPGKSARYDPTGAFDFPTGTVLMKSFGFPEDARVSPPVMHWLETRVLIKADDGWHAYPYLWNVTGTKATYDAGGRSLHVHWTDPNGQVQDNAYLQPAQTQCKQCHEADGVLTPIGPRARNLNRDRVYPSGTENQLAHWVKAGILTGAPDPRAAPVLAAWNDQTKSLDTRARAYLEGNCAHCHNATGSASTSGLFLFASEPDPLHYGVCKEPLSAGGMVGARQFDLVPTEPDASILWYRMTSVAPGIAMPQIGRDVVDAAGVALISDWIATLPKAACNHWVSFPVRASFQRDGRAHPRIAVKCRVS